MVRLDLPQDIQPRHVRQRQIQQQHITGGTAQERQCLAAVLGLTHPGEVRLALDDLLEPDPYELVIVNDCDSYARHGKLFVTLAAVAWYPVCRTSVLRDRVPVPAGEVDVGGCAGGTGAITQQV